MTSDPSSTSSTQNISNEYPHRGGRPPSAYRVKTSGPANRTVGTNSSPSSESSSVTSSFTSPTERSSSIRKLIMTVMVDGTKSTGTSSATKKSKSIPSLLSRMEQAGMLAHDSLQLSTEELLVENKSEAATQGLARPTTPATKPSEPLTDTVQCSSCNTIYHLSLPIGKNRVVESWNCNMDAWPVLGVRNPSCPTVQAPMKPHHHQPNKDLASNVETTERIVAPAQQQQGETNSVTNNETLLDATPSPFPSGDKKVQSEIEIVTVRCVLCRLHRRVPVTVVSTEPNQWKCSDWEGQSCGVARRTWNHVLELFQKGGVGIITSKVSPAEDGSSMLTALVGGRQVRVSITMDESSQDTTDETTKAAASTFDETHLNGVPAMRGTKRRRTEQARRSFPSPSPERVLSRTSRRKRRSGGEVEWMSLQISYRGMDWDPLNSCWVPKQKKTSRPKPLGRRDGTTTNEPTTEMNMSDENPTPITGRTNHDMVHQETNCVSGPLVQEDAIQENLECLDAKDSASVSNEVVDATKAEPALQNEEYLPTSAHLAHGVPTADGTDLVLDVGDSEARQDTFPQLLVDAPTLSQGHIHPMLLSPEAGPVHLSAQLAGSGVAEMPVKDLTPNESKSREGLSGAAHLPEQTQCPPRDQCTDDSQTIVADKEWHGRGSPDATIENRIDATVVGSHTVQDHGSDRATEMHHFQDSGNATPSFEQVGDSEPIMAECNTLMKAINDKSATDIEGSTAEANAEILEAVSEGIVPPSFAVHGYRVSAYDPPFADHRTLQQVGPSTHSLHGEGLRDSIALTALHQPAVRDTSSQDSVEVDNESNPLVQSGDQSQVEISSEEDPEMADTILGEEEGEDIKVAVLIEGVDRPAALPVNKEDYEVLPTDTKMGANYVSAPSVTRQEQNAVEGAFAENHPLGALFEAVEMVHEVPVSDAEEEALGCAANGEDIFADAPDDDVIEFAEPLIGEEIARRLPRTALNLDVYGPTPPHMAEVWYKMYGSRW